MKPKILAPVVIARLTSDSVIPPTPELTISTSTSSLPILSKDAFIAPKNQTKPFWMTSSESKKLAHKWRAEEDAILVGRITAEKDNPSLTVRKVEGSNPIRIVIDKDLKLSADFNLFNYDAKTIVFNQLKSEENNSNNYIKINFNNLTKNILQELHIIKKHISSMIYLQEMYILNTHIS